MAIVTAVGHCDSGGHSDSVGQDQSYLMEDSSKPATTAEPAPAALDIKLAETWRGVENEDEYTAAADTCLRLSKVVLSDVHHGFTDVYGGRTDAYRALLKTEWKLKERFHYYGGIIDKLPVHSTEPSIQQLSEAPEVFSYLLFLKQMTGLDAKTKAVCLADSACTYKDMEWAVWLQLQHGKDRITKDLEEPTGLPGIDLLREQSRLLVRCRNRASVAQSQLPPGDCG